MSPLTTNPSSSTLSLLPQFFFGEKRTISENLPNLYYNLFLSLFLTVDHFRYSETFKIERAHIEELPLSAAFAAMGLGFALSLLVFMDQNIAEAMVNNPCNK